MNNQNNREIRKKRIAQRKFTASLLTAIIVVVIFLVFGLMAAKKQEEPQEKATKVAAAEISDYDVDEAARNVGKEEETNPEGETEAQTETEVEAELEPEEKQYVFFEQPELVATMTVSSGGSDENRNFNMALACQTINGMVLYPGEVFDWFEVIGPADDTMGYKLSTIIANKQYVQGYGGGICQVSTTLYNAIDQLGIIPDVLNHHSKSVTYISEGRDATVSYPQKNFVFTNTLEYPIQIGAYTNGGSVTVDIYKIGE